MPAHVNIIRAAACQTLTYPDPAKSAAKVVEWLRQAKDRKVRLVAFPEGCLHGYTAAKSFWRKVKPAAFAAAERKVADACRRLRIAAVLGSAHHEGGRWFNSLAIIDPAGRLVGRYSKTFLAGEKWFASGREIPLCKILGIPCCFLVCHDIRFPELVRLPAVRGAKLCVYCSCESPLTAEYKLSAYRAMPISRATENGIWLIMANTPADPRDVARAGQSHGNSMIVDPDGNVVAEAGHFEERLVVADLDMSKATGWIAEKIAAVESPIREWVRQGARMVKDA